MFLENAKRDPLTGEIGKTIIFCVSQAHAGKIANILNKLIKEYEPEYENTFSYHFVHLYTVQDTLSRNGATHSGLGLLHKLVID